jgi:hypothetical protein
MAPGLLTLSTAVLCNCCASGLADILALLLLLFAPAPTRDAKALFTDWKGGFYQHNKLANVYTAFELQRRCASSTHTGYSTAACHAVLVFELSPC